MKFKVGDKVIPRFYKVKVSDTISGHYVSQMEEWFDNDVQIIQEVDNKYQEVLLKGCRYWFKFEWLDLADESSKTESSDDGKDADYYRINPKWKMIQDIIEERSLNYSQGNILKVAFTMNVGRHSGTNYERDLNKLIWFANRELNRIKND